MLNNFSIYKPAPKRQAKTNHIVVIHCACHLDRFFFFFCGLPEQTAEWTKFAVRHNSTYKRRTSIFELKER